MNRFSSFGTEEALDHLATYLSSKETISQQESTHQPLRLVWVLLHYHLVG